MWYAPPANPQVGTLRLTRVGLLFSAATCLLLPLVADVRVASKAGALVSQTWVF